jgi:hypothetical protein
MTIHTHGFLTTDLIELAYFPPPPGGRAGTCSRVYQRMADLWRCGCVQRLELPVSRHLGGRRPYLYALGHRGVPIVQERWSEHGLPVAAPRCDRLGGTNLDHDLAAAALWANLTGLLRRLRAPRFPGWIPEPEIRARHLTVPDRDGRRKLPWLPDGAFSVRYRDGSVQRSLVEIDMGTLTLRRFRRKVRAFEAFIALGLAGPVIGEDYEVVVLTRSGRRLEDLRAVARDEVPEDRESDYLFATLDVLEPAKFANAPWLTLEGRAVQLLWSKAYEQAPARAGGAAERTPQGGQQ